MDMELLTIQRSSSAGSPPTSTSKLAGLAEEDTIFMQRNDNECYFADKGTGIVLGSNEQFLSCNDGQQLCSVRGSKGDLLGNPNTGCDIQQHLQSMFFLLRREETLKMAVKLETARTGRTRYLVVVSRPARPQAASPSNSASNSSISTTNNNNNNNAQSTRYIASTSGCSGSLSSSMQRKKCTLTAKYANSRNTTTTITTTTTTTTPTTTTSSSSSATSTTPKYQDISKSMTRTLTDTKLQNCDSSSSSGGGSSSTEAMWQHSGDPVLLSDSDDDSSDSNRNCNEVEESCLLGIDCNEKTTVGLVLRILADTTIRLDGDGGFSISVFGRTHIFKPVSVQAMWSALQTLHKVSGKARSNNYYPGGPSHEWVQYYEDRIQSERSCLNEWNAMDSLESRRPPSPDAVRNKPTQREETEYVIKTTLKEIMMSVDLDEVTSKYIRSRLEEHLDMDLGEFKSFIDQEMLIILGQMDSPTEIFDHVYLGSEWNASNLEELQRNGVGHILNVTREIDNFFPGMFDYFNVRVYDDEKTNLLKHWDNTFKYITRARKAGSKVLVHCKMGVSRSASVVIAYAMKAHDLNFTQALKHVKKKRSCIKPNKSFLTQLETYQGMLDAMKNKEKLQRSKSETNLRSSSNNSSVKDGRLLPGSEPTPLIQALNAAEKIMQFAAVRSACDDLRRCKRRPKSWSPDHVEAAIVLLPKQQSQSLENLTPERKEEKTKNVLLPCSNGQNYSVSQNQVVHLQENFVPSVKLIVSELESTNKVNGKGLLGGAQRPLVVTKVTSSLDASSSTTGTIVRKDTWDPGDSDETNSNKGSKPELVKNSNLLCDSPTSWTSSSAQIILKQQPATYSIGSESLPLASALTAKSTSNPADQFSAQLDNAFEREENKHRHSMLLPATVDLSDSSAQSVCAPFESRQSSFSSIDSAVVLGYAGDYHHRELPSRHSSWGSGDNSRHLPSRNSSWGSYDIRNSGGSTINTSAFLTKGTSHVPSGVYPYEREDIPWHPGTVKRTKQKIENTTEVLRNCAPPAIEAVATTTSCKKARAIDILLLSDQKKRLLELQVGGGVGGGGSSTKSSRYNSEETLSARGKMSPAAVLHNRLSASAPETSTMGCILKKKLPSFRSNNKHMLPQRSLDEGPGGSVGFHYGIVQNLKMSFEAREDNAKKVKSLPSSPIAAHPHQSGVDQFQKFNDAAAVAEQILEEINVKDLVDRYEVTKTRPPVSSVTALSLGPANSALKPRPRSVFETRQPQHINCSGGLSKPLMITHSTIIPKTDELRRPPVPPPTVRNTLGSCPAPQFLNSSAAANAMASGCGAGGVVVVGGGGAGLGGSVTSNVTGCKRMQQHGKTHPLSRLGLPQQRLNTATYNTM